ncbi:MAG: ABC transporter ATP-binding protein [Nitrososphaerota archaeon]
MEKPVVSMVGITKKYPGVTANEHVTFTLHPGEIHGLLGENGAGKTTLMNILSGLVKPDAGEIYIRGEKVQLRSPLDAIKRGVGMVHQHFTLVNSLTVTENIALGLDQHHSMNDEVLKKRIEDAVTTYNLKVDPNAKIWQLSVGEKQRVEILRLLIRRADILIFDEPTSVLTPLEASSLFKGLKSMSEMGKSIILVSHKLNEVMGITNRVTVLRKGRVVGSFKTSEIDKRSLVRFMIGSDLSTASRDTMVNAEQHNPLLKVEGLEVLNDKGVKALKGISLHLRGGEILGIAGVAGNGQRELLEAIYGLRRKVAGRVLLGDMDISKYSPGRLRKLGVTYIPEDRIETGVLPDLPIRHNLVLGMLDAHLTRNGMIIRRKEMEAIASRLVSEYDIKASDLNIPVEKLSGGNIQRLVVARELYRSPAVILAASPTKGLDLAATAFVRSKLVEARNRGAGVLLASEDLDEVIELSDRIAVMFEGKLTAVNDERKNDLNYIGALMTGVAA